MLMRLDGTNNKFFFANSLPMSILNRQLKTYYTSKQMQMQGKFSIAIWSTSSQMLSQKLKA